MKSSGNRIVWLFPVPSTVPLMVLGFFALALPFIVPVALLFMLGRALFKWRLWCGWCYTGATVALFVWGTFWVQQQYDLLEMREFRRVVLQEPVKHPQRRASNQRHRLAQTLPDYSVPQ